MIGHRERYRYDAIDSEPDGPDGSAAAAKASGSQDARTTGRLTLAGLALVAPLVLSMLVRSSVLFLGAWGLVLAVSVLAPMIGMIALAVIGPFPRPLVVQTAGVYLAVVGAVLLGIVLRLPVERPRLSRPPAHVWAIGALVVYAAAHLIGGLLDGPASSRGFSDIAPTFFQFTVGALTFLAAGLVVRGRSPFPIVAALLVGAVLASTTALAQSMGAESLVSGLIWPAEDRAATAVDRVTGPLQDPNYFGAYLATAIMLGLACVVIARSTRVKATVIAVSGFLSAALLLTLSRGALVALVAGVITLAFTRGLRKGLLMVSATVVAAVIAWPLFAGARFAADPSRAAGGLAAQLGESSDRTGAWVGGLEAFLSSPVFGVGWGRLVDEVSTGIPAHNWYITILGETGIVGFILWAVFLVTIAAALRKRSRTARTVGFTVLVTWMVASMFLELPLVYAATGLALMVLGVAISADWPAGGADDHPAAVHVGPAAILGAGAGQRSVRPALGTLSRRSESWIGEPTAQRTTRDHRL